MANRPVPSVAADFSDVLSFLRERGIVSASPPAILIESAKRVHRATYSLILWRFRLGRLPEHGRAFIEEIASDSLQVLPQMLMGYGKTTKLLTRGIIENTFRHIYFSDHPIEFARMNRDSKWYVTMESLFDYVKMHPVFLESEPRFDAINRLSTLYSELSAGIHGRRVQDLEMRLALRKIRYEEGEAKKHAKLIEKCVESTNFLLAMFHRDKVNAFQEEDRRIILQTIPAKARRVYKGCL
jgi:hypothetical protein